MRGEYMQNIALITGITGQDGSYLAELLLEKEKITRSEFEALFEESETDA